MRECVKEFSLPACHIQHSRRETHTYRGSCAEYTSCMCVLTAEGQTLCFLAAANAPGEKFKIYVVSLSLSVRVRRQDKKFRRRLINFRVFHKSERAKCKCAHAGSRATHPLYMNHPHSLALALHCFGLGNWIWLLSQLATLAERTHNAADFMIGHDLNCGGAEWVDFNLYVISHSHGLWVSLNTWYPDT
jgi:hypothetical protein